MPIRSRVSIDEYVKLPGLNISTLKEIKRSPMHYKYRLENPKQTKPMTLGTAAHMAALEPDRFATHYAIWSNRTASGNLAPRNGAKWDEFKLVNDGRDIITEDEASDAMAIAAAVRADANAMKYLAAGDPEVTMQWEKALRPCKGRADWLTVNGVDRPTIVGLKTARDCSPYLFGSQAAKLSYHLQFAFYFDGHTEVTGVEPEMVEIVVENTAPYAVAVYRIPPDVIEQGRDEYMRLLDTLDECESTGQWPGPVPFETDLSLPSWVYPQQDDIGDLELE